MENTPEFADLVKALLGTVPGWVIAFTIFLHVLQVTVKFSIGTHAERTLKGVIVNDLSKLGQRIAAMDGAMGRLSQAILRYHGGGGE
jgi:hypothetical protein